MLGAEGVKSLVLDRLVEMVPVAVEAVSARVGAAPGEIPVPVAYHPSAVPAWSPPTGSYPFVTVTAADTNADGVSNEILEAHEIVEEFSFEYDVTVSVYTMVSGQDGEPLARLQAERILLAIREALLAHRDLPHPDPAVEDHAVINFGRWAEDYDTTFDADAGAWLGGAAVMVPVRATEYLDRAPYIGKLTYLAGSETYAVDLRTGEPVPGTVGDGVDYDDTTPPAPLG